MRLDHIDSPNSARSMYIPVRDQTIYICVSARTMIITISAQTKDENSFKNRGAQRIYYRRLSGGYKSVILTVHNTIQYNTIQYTIQYNTIYNTNILKYLPNRYENKTFKILIKEKIVKL